MRHGSALALTALALMLAGPSHAACPPGRLVLSSIRDADLALVLRLGPRATREVDWDSGAPGRMMGFEVLDSSPLPPAEASALARVLASASSYDCRAPRPVPARLAAAVDMGLLFRSDVAHVRVVLHVEEKQVEVEFMNGAHTRSALTPAALARLEAVIETHATRTAGSRKAWNARMRGAQEPPRPAPADSSGH